jgi:hypothetical protein
MWTRHWSGWLVEKSSLPFASDELAMEKEKLAQQHRDAILVLDYET